MNSFDELALSKSLYQALEELAITHPTPIQAEAFKVILSGKDVVGIAQTGTGKTFAYLLPLLRDLKFSREIHPRILILVPTRELVLQVVEQVRSLTKHSPTRTLGVYGGTNMNTQALKVSEGMDVLVATPGRLYDLLIKGALRLKEVKRLVIDEVDIMLDLGFRYQLENIFDLLPERRQNLMFSATMTEEVDALIDDFFTLPVRISIAVSGTPLENIGQQACLVKNFYTKANLLIHLLKDRVAYNKVLVFVSTKKSADRLFELLEEPFGSEACVIHSNKSQNYRIRSVRQFDEGINRILVTTDVMARGLDLEKISHVISFDTPAYPENYMHRIGRTGRAEQQGHSLLFYTENEVPSKEAIEALMNYRIPDIEFPGEVAVSGELTPEESPRKAEVQVKPDADIKIKGGAFHEKKEKNRKTNQGGSYLRKMKNYKKPKTKGDKNFNRRNKKK
ncbi:MAG: DEAD/DEAH box helicase [Bacteroidales bacterium]|nr:DEAD/DEAH box helicase [Bacteroidales bacterium]